MNVSAAVDEIASYVIDSADRLNEASMLSLAIILQPYLKGVQVFLNNPRIDQFVNAEDIRSTELGSVVFEYVESDHSVTAYMKAVGQLKMLLSIT